MLDYVGIKRLAVEVGCNVTDLIALAPANDPFYAGVPARREAAEWFASLWTSCAWAIGSHPRRLHYNLISQASPILKPNGEPYQNTENDWKYFSAASLAARYLQLIPKGALADHRNDPPIINAEKFGTTAASVRVAGSGGAGLDYDLPDREVCTPWLDVENVHVDQAYLVELWVEKSTQNDILVPLASKLGFNLVLGTGETSEVLAQQTYERAFADGRPMRILYVSDFDPGGRSMPVALARKLEFWARNMGGAVDITLDPIVLTPQQCERYNLPRTPLKETERRAGKFEERFGTGATELDALEALYPGELATIVREEVCRYVDTTLTSRVIEAQWSYKRDVRDAEQEVLQRFDISQIQARFDAACTSFKDTVTELEGETEKLWPQIAEALEEVAPAFDPEDMPTPKPATPPDAPLFDSKRDYLDQIDHYRAWQGKGDTP